MSTAPCSGTLNNSVGSNQFSVYGRSPNDAQQHAEAAHPSSIISGMQQLGFNGVNNDEEAKHDEGGELMVIDDDPPAPALPQPVDQVWIHGFVQFHGFPVAIAVHLAALGITDLTSLWTYRLQVPESIDNVEQAQYDAFKTALILEFRHQGVWPAPTPAPTPTPAPANNSPAPELTAQGFVYPCTDGLLSMVKADEFIHHAINTAQQDESGVYVSYQSWDGTSSRVPALGNRLNGVVTTDDKAYDDLVKWWNKGPAKIKKFMDARVPRFLMQCNKDKRDNDARQQRAQRDQRMSQQQQARRERERAAQEAEQAYRQRLARIELQSSGRLALE